MGLIGEKDSGESFTWNQKSKGFDFYSAYIQVKDRGPLKNLIFGDYRLQMGQGLVYGSGYAPGKGREDPSGSTQKWLKFTAPSFPQRNRLFPRCHDHI